MKTKTDFIVELKTIISALFVFLGLFIFCQANAQQPLETETGQLLKAKSLEWENTFE